jgi:aspartate-semialdehyde dehydrogenase
MTRSYRVAVLGATGAVGAEFLRLFDERNFPISSLKLLASPRSAGKSLHFRGSELAVEAVSASSFDDVDIAFFSAGATRSKEFAPMAADKGVWVIDNSSAFRMSEDVPLVVPEVNADAIQPHHNLIANPNCTAAILLMAVAPIRKLGKIERIIVSTYQSASGAGAAAMEELRNQTQTWLDGGKIEPQIMPHPYAFNLFSHNTPINEYGYNDEEWKVMAECRKMLSEPNLRLNVTCIRVPVLRAHSESVTIEFESVAPTVYQIRDTLSNSPGVKLVDDAENNHFPMPNEVSGQDDVFVGRIRKDLSHPSAISMFVVGDQLLKGAALNAVQIGEHLIRTRV